MNTNLISQISNKSRFILLFLTIIFLQSTQAQVPNINPIMNENAFPGASFCSTVSLTNTGPPGFGPYLQLIVPEDVTFNSAMIFGSGATATTIGVFPAPPANMLTDTIISQDVTGPEGATLVLIQLPVGSLVAGAPALDLEVCFTIDNAATINDPLNITVNPVYQFGDTATGDNGPIIGSSSNFTATPILAEFIKTNSAPEGERPPGTSWPVNYTLTANIASTNTLTNIVINDNLPANFVLDPASVMIAGGIGCTDNGADPLIITCTSVTGTGGNDLVVTYSGHFSDALDESVCDSNLEINTATFDADFNSMAIPQLTDNSQVQLEHLSIQKGVSTENISPGDTITYTLNMQLTDFGTANSLVVTDILPDGLTFGALQTLSVNGGAVALVPTINNDTPAAGQTTLIFDIGAVTGDLTAGSSITLSYTASVDTDFATPPDPLLADDTLTNTVSASSGLTAGATACTDGSQASTTVVPVVPTKEVITTGPYSPGDTVTYRLSLAIPSGDTENVVFTDFFPLPVFDVNDINLTFGTGDIRLSPIDTMGLTPTSITINAATNSLRIEWPNISNTTPQTVSVDVDVTISTDPFADDLNLANLLQIDSNNSVGEVTTGVTPVTINVRAPVLTMVKGVSAADQGTIAPLPSVIPVDGDVTDIDAGDSITFVLTIENTGGARAFDVTITDPVIPELTGCSVDTVTNGNLTPLATSGSLGTGLSLTAPLEANDGSIGAPYSTDTALVTYTCTVSSTVQPESVFTNTASTVFASAVGGTPFPTLMDDASATVGEPSITKSVTNTAPDPDGNDATVTIGETVQYTIVITLPEGQSLNTTLTDVLDNGLIFQSFDSIVASAGLSTDHVGGFNGVLNDATGIGTNNASFPFDNITNSNTNNGTPDTITIVYTVEVADVAGNINGRNRNNNATFNYDGGNISDSANNVNIREPNVTIDKSVMPMVADAGDTVTYTIQVRNTGTSDAFNVNVTDLLADANLTLVDGTVNTSQGTVTTGNGGGPDTTVVVDVGTIPFSPVTTVTITFNAIVGAGAPSGAMLTNTASVTSDSLPAGGRPYGPTDDMANLTVSAAEITKVVLPATSTEQSGGVSGEGSAGLVDLTIGEEVTFRITATLAEGVSPSVIITDTLPGNATGQMEVVTSTVISVGANLTPTNTPLSGTIGPDNVVTFDFGSVTNAADGMINDDDRIIVEVTAIVTDDVVNSGLEVLTNNVMVQYSAGLNASASADIEVVEPRLAIDKSSPTTTADAGDTVTFTIEIRNDATTNSHANAFDVTLTDNIPAGFTFAGNLTLDSGLAPDGGTLMENAGVISAFWSNFTLGSTAVISFDVTIDNAVAPEQNIVNTAGVVWDSLPGANPEQRNSSANESHAVMISEPGLNKTVFNTSEASTMMAINGPEDDVAVGELVTYRFTLTLPEGTSLGAVVTDQLPTITTLMEAQVVGTQIISIGGQLTVPNAAIPPVISNSDADTYNDLVTWNLGDVINTPDGLNNTDDQIVFQVNAILVDDPVNQGGLNDVINTARFTSGSVNIESTALIDVVAPVIEVTKETVPASITADAGDTLTYRITIDHVNATSTSDAFNFTVTDVLPNPGTSWINDATVSSTCTGIATNSSADPSIVFTIPTLALATDSCTIEYQVSVDLGVNPNESYQNTVTATWTSTSVIGSETRTDSDMANSSFVTPDPAIIKSASSINTSLSDTGDNVGDMLVPDMAIGELIDFNITVIFPEGTTTNAVVVDQLPLVASGGVMEMVSATVNAIGGNLTTTLPGTAVITNTDADAFNDQATLDFGTVTNTPDGMVDTDDQITITVTARVVDVADNSNLDLLTNTATFTFGSGTMLQDTADIEVVAPLLGLTKSMGPMTDNVVPITLTLSNTGNAPAYDITIEDVLDTNIWDVSTISAITIPTGFIFSDAAGPGATDHTVTITSDPVGSTPATSVEPAEMIAFTFNVTLRDDVVIPTTIPNTATVTEASTLPGADPTERDLPDVDGSTSLAIPVLDSTKDATIVTDTNMSGGISPGEQILYTIIISNTGDGAANNITLSDAPDSNTQLDVGSVTTTSGTITTGNTAGDTIVVIDIASIASSSMVTITYTVTVNNPLPTGIDMLSNQGLIESDELPDSTTDDPDTGTDDDPTIVPVDGAPDLTISKDDGGTTAMAGGTVIYAISYQNIGTQDATGVTITETVPANSTFDAANSIGIWTCLPDNNAGSTCTQSIGAVDAGDPAAMTAFAVTVESPLAAGVTQLSNNTSIADDGTNGTDLDPANNSGSDNTPINSTPDLQISKDDGGVMVMPGQVITYLISYTNVGSQNATGVVITETVPAHTQFNAASSTVGWVCLPDNGAGSTCTFNVGNLAGNNGSGNVNFAVQVDNPLSAAVTQIDNTVSIADDGSNGADPTPADNSDMDNTPVNATPDMSVSKTDGNLMANAGDTVTYVISYDNIGNQNATGVVITETVPANSTFNAGSSTAGWACAPDNNAGSTCMLAIGAVAVNGGGMVNFAVDIDNPLPATVLAITNTVSIADDGSNGVDPDPDNNTGGDNTPVAAVPDLTINKDDGGATTTVGGTISYLINYSNIGTQQATGIVLTETVPAHTVFNSTASTAGWSCMPNNNAGSTCTLSVPDLNGGGASAMATFAVDVIATLPAGVEMIDNTISINDDGSNGPDADPNNNDDSDDTPVTAVPDLQITKDDGGITSMPGSVVTYLLTYSNIGTQDATGVMITETVPANSSFDAGNSTAGWACIPDNSAGSTCTLNIGAVTAGASAGSANFAVLIDTPLPSGVTQITNSVSIADDGTNGADPTPGNNGDNDNTPIDAAPDLSVSKLDNGATADAGDTVAYTISYDNIGNQNATGVVITETVPANTVFNAGASTAGWICAPDNNAGSTCTFNIGALSVNGGGNLIFAITIDNPLPSNVKAIVNTVSIADDGSNGIDPDPDNNTGGDNTPVGSVPDLTVTKDDGGITATVGASINYTINYANVGTQESTGVILTETVPLYTTFNPTASTIGWNCIPNNDAGSTCTLAIGSLNGGGDSGMANFVVDVIAILPAGVENINNTINVSDDGDNGVDANPNNNDAQDQTPVTAVPDLTISKDDGGGTFNPGEVVIYRLSYDNVGTQDATGVVITETVPLHSTFSAANSNGIWNCVPDGSAGSICSQTIGNVAAADGPVTTTFAVIVDNPLAAGVTQLNNTVSIGDDGNNGVDPNPDDNDATDNTPIDAVPDLSITKTDNGTSAEAGDTVVYQLTYSNVGNQNATGVVITETVPANTVFNATASTAGWVCAPDNNPGSNCQFTVGALNVGAPGMVLFAVDIDNPLPTNVKTIENVTSIADDGANGIDPDPDNNTGGDNTPVGSVPDLTITKDDQGITTVAGGTIVYTIDYANIGDQESTGIVITETVPLHTTFNAAQSSPGWSCTPDNTAGSTCQLSVPDLNGGGDSASVQYAVDVIDVLPAGVDDIDNTTSIADDGDNGADADPNNNNDDDNTPIDAAPDLNLQKVDQSNMVITGGTIIYDLTYENLGPQDATGVVITETVPDHTTFDPTSSDPNWVCTPDNNAGSTCTFSVGDLNVSDGASTIQFAVIVDDPLPAGIDQIFNTATIGDDGNNGDDPDDSNNTDPEDTDVGAFPDLTITKTDGDITSGPGQTIVYTLDYANIGNQNATGVTITETVPANTSYNDVASSVSWSCTPDDTAGSVCTYLVGSLAADESGSVTFAVVVDDPLALGVNIVINEVSIADDGTNGADANPDNNDDSDDTSLQLEPPVGLKIGEFDADNPRVIHWTFWWFNPNNDRDLPVFIFDEMPDNTVFFGNESCTATGTSTCTVPVFNANLNRLELTAILGEDQGAAPDSTPEELNNEIIIRFDTLISGVGVQSVENQAMANWDQDNDGDPNNDANSGQIPIPTDDPVSIEVGDPTRLGVALLIPTLGLPAMIVLIMALGLMVRRRLNP